MKQIKDIHAKILTSQNLMVVDLFSSLSSRPKTHYIPVCKREELPVSVMNLQTSRCIIKKSCSWLVSHVGYDTSAESALDTLSDIASRYISDIAQTIKFYMDRYNSINHTDIFLYSLKENGIADCRLLFEYIKRDVVNYGNQLHELRLRLEYAYTYLDQDDDDIDIDKHGDQIIRYFLLL
jgi:hypothetical protein